jgi:hypothetical protein
LRISSSQKEDWSFSSAAWWQMLIGSPIFDSSYMLAGRETTSSISCITRSPQTRPGLCVCVAYDVMSDALRADSGIKAAVSWSQQAYGNSAMTAQLMYVHHFYFCFLPIR